MKFLLDKKKKLAQKMVNAVPVKPSQKGRASLEVANKEYSKKYKPQTEGDNETNAA